MISPGDNAAVLPGRLPPLIYVRQRGLLTFERVGSCEFVAQLVDVGQVRLLQLHLPGEAPELPLVSLGGLDLGPDVLQPGEQRVAALEEFLQLEAESPGLGLLTFRRPEDGLPGVSQPLHPRLQAQLLQSGVWPEGALHRLVLLPLLQVVLGPALHGLVLRNDLHLEAVDQNQSHEDGSKMPDHVVVVVALPCFTDQVRLIESETKTIFIFILSGVCSIMRCEVKYGERNNLI